MPTPSAEPRWYHVGPHGFYDLVRFARRGRSVVVRVGYILALFAVLAAVYYNEVGSFSTPKPREHRRFFVDDDFDAHVAINTNARIAERFSIAILVMQNLAVLVLMPIYVASSMQEERDKRTLPLLFTTHLTVREIALGKWVSCVGHVGTILLGGLPILSFVQLWGGIDMPMIAANFVNTACWLFSIAAFSLVMATQSGSVFRAVTKTYVLLLGALSAASCCCCLPTTFGDKLGFAMPFLVRPTGGEDGYSWMTIALAIFVASHIACTFGLLLRATSNLETQRGDERMLLGPDDVSGNSISNLPFRVSKCRKRPPILDDALLWKECYGGVETFLEGAGPLLAAIYVGYGIVLILPAWLNQDPEHRMFKELAAYFTASMLPCFAIYTLVVAFHLAGSVVRERERQTLGPLLTLPITRTELLAAKVKGTLLRYRLWLWPFGISWLAWTILNDQFVLGGLLLFIALVVHLAFFAMLGLSLSVFYRTTLSAYVSLGLVFLMLVIGTIFVKGIVPRDGGADFMVYGVNPIGCWIAIASGNWPNLRFAGVDVVGASLGGYAAFALALWVLASRRFARESG